MCPKKLEIDNRSKKTPLVHRFMTTPAPSETPSPAEENKSLAEENIPSAQESGNTNVEITAEIIPDEPPEDNPPPVQDQSYEDENIFSAEESDSNELIITEVTAAPSSDEITPFTDVEAVNTDDKTEESDEVDYKKFITTVQDKIDGITNTQLQAQEDMKAQLKAELIAEIKNELKNELREEIAAQSKPVSEPVKEPVKQAPPQVLEKAGETRYTFRNTMEDIVAEEVTGILKNEKNMCKCSRCVNDICAIALNAIPPHYVTSEVGQLYDRAGLLDITKLSELTKNIFNAIDQVKSKPAHPLY